jgi:hypothetical protein
MPKPLLGTGRLLHVVRNRFILRVVVELVVVAITIRVANALYGQLAAGRFARADSSDRCCGPGCRTSLAKFARRTSRHSTVYERASWSLPATRVLTRTEALLSSLPPFLVIVLTDYDEKYFAWQTGEGLKKARLTNFTALLGVRPHMTVADLGAGGGHILASLDAAKLYAVELNAHARKQMEIVYPGRIRSVTFVEDLVDNSIDLFYTTSVIEHVECPLTELREMYHKIKPGGTVVVYVPFPVFAFLRRLVSASLSLLLQRRLTFLTSFASLPKFVQWH